MTPDERRLVALHEAGHAVAAYVLGLPSEYASIREGRTFAGLHVGGQHETPGVEGLPMVPTLPGTPPELRAAVERRIICDLAGDLAALYLAGRPATRRYAGDEAERIARDALASLGPRLAELVVEHEEREEATATDEEAARGLAAALVGPDGVGHYVEALRVEARALVVRYAAAILRVADALERRAVLSGEELAALVKGD